MRGAILGLSSFYPAIFASVLPPCFPDLRLPIRGSRFEPNKHGTREQEWIMAKITKRAVDALQRISVGMCSPGTASSEASECG